MSEPSATRLHGLDTLRTAAILSVMPYHLVNHFPEALHGPARFGWMGVDLFFVLSGYLIGSQMFRPYLGGGTLRIRDFYARRAYRILPLFVAVLLLYVLVPAWREAPGLQPWWQFASFTENLLIDYRDNQAFSHAWSLCVEEHFYLLLPLLTVLLMRRPATWKVYATLVAVLVLGICARAFVLLHSLRPLGPDNDLFATRYLETMYYPTYVRLDGLLAGVALALVRAFRPGWWAALTRRGHSLAGGAVAVLGFAAWLSVPRFESLSGRAVLGDLFGYPLLGLGFAMLTASALSTNGLLARVRVPGARGLATLAFSLYLTHKEAVHLLLTLFPRLPDGTYWMLPVYFGVCIVLAAAFHFGVERPFMLMRERRAGGVSRLPALELQARMDPAL